MKFDICLMNPPYGSVGGDTIHLKFVDKCLDFASTQVVVMPFKFVTKIYHKPAKKFKEKFSPYLSEVEEVDSKCFIGTEMYNVGIYVFGDETQNIDIKYVNSQNETLPSLLDKSEFTVYEKEIIQYLEKQGSQEIIWAGGNRKLKSELQNIAVENHKDFLKKKIIDSCKNLKQQLNTYKSEIIVNNSNGRMNGKAFSLKSGQIFNSYEEFENFFIERNVANGYNVILFNSVKAAENCKIALQNPLLRFTIYRSQDDQNMGHRVYRYIPNIDWSDDRVKTDEGLLQMCGCAADKAKEYAEYCKKIIEEVDKK